MRNKTFCKLQKVSKVSFTNGDKGQPSSKTLNTSCFGLKLEMVCLVATSWNNWRFSLILAWKRYKGIKNLTTLKEEIKRGNSTQDPHRSVNLQEVGVNIKSVHTHHYSFLLFSHREGNITRNILFLKGVYFINHLSVFNLGFCQVLAIRFHHSNKVLQDRRLTGCTFLFKAVDVICDPFKEIHGNTLHHQQLSSDHAFAHGIYGALWVRVILCWDIRNKEIRKWAKSNVDVQNMSNCHCNSCLFPFLS